MQEASAITRFSSVVHSGRFFNHGGIARGAAAQTTAVQPAFHTLFLSTANTSHRWDLNDLFHPAKAFDRPSDVVGDPDLTLNENDHPGLVQTPVRSKPLPARRALTGKRPMPNEEVMGALRALQARQRAVRRQSAIPSLAQRRRVEARYEGPSLN